MGRRQREVFRGKEAKPGSTNSFLSIRPPFSSVSQQGSSSVFTSSPPNESVFPTMDTEPLSLSGRRSDFPVSLLTLTLTLTLSLSLPSVEKHFDLHGSLEDGCQISLLLVGCQERMTNLTFRGVFWCNFLCAGETRRKNKVALQIS